jgi:hypothetical protein
MNQKNKKAIFYLILSILFGSFQSYLHAEERKEESRSKLTEEEPGKFPKVLETNLSIEELWQKCVEEAHTLEGQVPRRNKNKICTEVAEAWVDCWAKANQFLPNKSGIRTRGINGPGWVGEIRACTLPGNIKRGIPPYIKIGLITKSDGKTGIFYIPKEEKTLEYLNMGGDWLGYKLKDTEDAPEIIETN